MSFSDSKGRCAVAARPCQENSIAVAELPRACGPEALSTQVRKGVDLGAKRRETTSSTSPPTEPRTGQPAPTDPDPPLPTSRG